MTVSTPPQLLVLRDRIDEIDAQLLDLVAERFKVTYEIGVIKKNQRLDPVDPAREQAKLDQIRRLAGERDVDPALACDILRLLMNAAAVNHRRLNDE